MTPLCWQKGTRNCHFTIWLISTKTSSNLFQFMYLNTSFILFFKYFLSKYYVPGNKPGTKPQRLIKYDSYPTRNLLSGNTDCPRTLLIFCFSGSKPATMNIFCYPYGNPVQYSCWDNPMGRGAWWATVHGATKSRTRLTGWAHARLTSTKKIIAEILL